MSDRLKQLELVKRCQPKYASIPYDELRLCYIDKVTVALVFSGHYRAIGIAKCHSGNEETKKYMEERAVHGDQFNHKIGRSIAIGRAMHALKRHFELTFFFQGKYSRSFMEGHDLFSILVAFQDDWDDEMIFPAGFFSKEERHPSSGAV